MLIINAQKNLQFHLITPIFALNQHRLSGAEFLEIHYLECIIHLKTSGLWKKNNQSASCCGIRKSQPVLISRSLQSQHHPELSLRAALPFCVLCWFSPGWFYWRHDDAVFTVSLKDTCMQPCKMQDVSTKHFFFLPPCFKKGVCNTLRYLSA